MPGTATKQREVRACKGLEIRESKVDGVIGVLTGYAAVFNQRSEVMYDFVEIVKPGAFKRSLDAGDDVRALAHHASSGIIGRRSAKTLRIVEDAKGLAVEIDMPDTTVGRDLVTLVRRGDVSGMSFGFETVLDEWSYERLEGQRELYIRTLVDVNLFEISAVVWPAYTGTSVEARSIAELLATAKASREKRAELDGENATRFAKRDAVIARYRQIRDIYCD